MNKKEKELAFRQFPSDIIEIAESSKIDDTHSHPSRIEIG